MQRSNTIEEYEANSEYCGRHNILIDKEKNITNEE